MARYLKAPAFVALALLAAAVILLGGIAAQRTLADTSGPNASGYFWVDNNAPDPVTTFDWIDATGGTISDVEDADDDWETVTLPFSFNFFGADYSEVDISSNGFLSFDIDNECNDNYNWGPDPYVLGFPIPHDDADCDGDDDGWGGNPLIASWFDDLDPGECGDVFYDTVGSAPNRTFVVQFDDVCHDDCELCEPGEGVTFETILYEGSNDIKVQYDDTYFGEDSVADENYGASATTGIDEDATTGLQYSWADPINDGLAVLYTAQVATPTPTPTPTATPSPGIVLEPATATNEVGTEHTVTATVTDAAAGTDVTFEVTDGPNSGDTVTDSTDADDKATFTYTGDGGAGTDTIEACVTVEAEPTPTPTATATATPTPTATATPTPTATPTSTPEPPSFSLVPIQPGQAAVLAIGDLPGVAEARHPAQAQEEICDTATKTWTEAAPAALPPTGGEPSGGGSSDLAWLAVIAGAIAVMSAGGVWFARQRRRVG